jgi:hypothetical protein
LKLGIWNAFRASCAFQIANSKFQIPNSKFQECSPLRARLAIVTRLLTATIAVFLALTVSVLPAAGEWCAACCALEGQAATGGAVPACHHHGDAPSARLNSALHLCGADHHGIAAADVQVSADNRHAAPTRPSPAVVASNLASRADTHRGRAGADPPSPLHAPPTFLSTTLRI